MLTDIRYALRQLRKSPAFMLTAILTLALGIGANTAIFSLLDQALLRSLPVRDPKQLVLLEATPYDAWNGGTTTNGGDNTAYFSYPMYKDLRDRNQAFDGLIAMFQTQVGVEWQKHSALNNAELVSGNYFDVLGVRPAVGRLLVQADDVVKNGSPVVVLGFDYWKNHMGADPHAVGQTLDINGHPFQIIGVSAPGFASAIWGSPADLFIPMTMKPVVTPTWDDLDLHNSRWLNILGRLKPGESRAQAQAAMAPLWHALRAAEIPVMENTSPRFFDRFVTHSQLEVHDGTKGFSYSRNSLRTPLLVMMGMVALVILMASVNVASLVLVRAAGRTREFSMRYALGANRAQIVRQLVIEGLLLGVTGGVAGFALAPAVVRVLASRITNGSGQPPFSTGIDLQVLAFNFAIALCVSLLFALAPALQLRKPDLAGQMKQQGAGSVGGHLGFRRLTVGLQIGLSLLLLVASGLFVRTLRNLRSVNVGFATDHLITFGIEPNLAGYSENSVGPLHRRILQTLAVLPGVVSVGATTDPELADDGNGGNISIQGYERHNDESMNAEQPIVTAQYLSTLRVPLLAGRYFTEADDMTHPAVAIVNETLAKRFFGTPEKAIGHMAYTGPSGKQKDEIQIVGVVRDYLHRNMRDTVKMTLYHSAAQDKTPGGMNYYVRTWGAPQAAMGAIRHAIAGIDSKLVIDSLTTMDGQIDLDLSNERMIAMLAVSFGVLATLLAAIGLYGVLAYATAQRTREIGVRMALGADRRGVVVLVLRDVLTLAGISLIAAIPVALLVTRTLKSQLFGVSTADPTIYICGALLVSVVAVLSAALPARRAASIEPSVALRSE
ncbi:ABC transporter permease [Paracidobacterium acidisoli]|uniref:Permease n=1 Tax=Paracidobacterium acidisoli TaxID=2303751 RepID=A0A372IST9_9BACT|nr:ABC transporter permease [Paracidobacterium acidisoli]MBT9330789.1 ABC transporter permease [Paracidobacterium acidisoli]